MSIEYRININRTADAIFSIYKDVDSWAKWDPDIEAVALQGAFTAGTRGWLKPVGAPKTKTLMIAVNEPTSFIVESKLPLCTMRFEHELISQGNSTDVIHRVLFSGPLATVFSRIIGHKINKNIENTMQGLKRYAESRK